MSEVFSCLVINRRVQEVTSLLEKDSCTDLVLTLDSLEPTLTLVHHPGRRDDHRFAHQMDRLAADLSRQLDKVLAIDFDSRTGCRSSRLFVQGTLAISFGAENELWVPLDDDGYPILDGPRRRVSELNEDDEYETVENAIELGLQAMGQGDWKTIHDFLSKC